MKLPAKVVDLRKGGVSSIVPTVVLQMVDRLRQITICGVVFRQSNISTTKMAPWSASGRFLMHQMCPRVAIRLPAKAAVSSMVALSSSVRIVAERIDGKSSDACRIGELAQAT